jgi:hypothetical protein
MKAICITVSGFLLLGGINVTAQENAEDADEVSEAAPEAETIDDFEPAVDTSAAEHYELQRGVPSQQLTADSRRPVGTRGVMDELDLGATEVTGNQELPKVMYIVPWRESDPGDLMGRPANTLLDDVLAPVDRREFVREVDYYSDLFDETKAQ